MKIKQKEIQKILYFAFSLFWNWKKKSKQDIKLKIVSISEEENKFDPIQIKSIQKSFQKGILSMAASYLPSILVPLVGLVFPAVAMASLFLYIEKEEIV
jgi:photosystem I subunit 8|eukprot:jgi/Botrbrau1/11433/Bobra.0151s0060.1